MKLKSTMWCIAAVCFLVTNAGAQCPASVTNPLNLISGTWAFQTNDGLSGDATVGTFAASTAPIRNSTVLQGVLSIKETFNNAAVIEIQTTGTGSYRVNADCSGGVLNFKVADNVYQYAFVMQPGGTEMYLVSENEGVPNTGLGPYTAGNRGIAKLLSGTPTCGSANPLSTFAGTWAFLTQDYESAETGRIVAQISPSSGLGVLTSLTTGSGFGGNVIVQAPGTGRYEIYPDCSGGQLYINTSELQYQYAFVFVGPSEIFMVSDNNTPLSNTEGVFRANFGDAKKF
jgi:hypothetical protein